jgi:hypothetical protein
MKSLIVKGVLAIGLSFATANSFADAELVGVTCPDTMCKCDSGGTSSCCGSTSCSLSGSTCTCS